MLSEKKMIIGQSSIDFLGVNISNGKYVLQPHIAASLGEFPDKLTSASIPIISSTDIFGKANNDLFRSKLSEIEIMSQA